MPAPSFAEKLPTLARILDGTRLDALDVGAAGGVPEQWRPLLPFLDVTAFEPDADECARQRESAPNNVHWFPVALAGTTGKANFYVLNRATGSSLLPPNDAVLGQFAPRSYWGIRRVVELDCQSLDDFLNTSSRPSPQLVKLDTQGSELDILSALSDARWADVLAVEAEVEFLELYRGQPLFPDVHDFMTKKGFQLFDLRTHRAYRASETTDNVYLKERLKIAVGRPSLSAQLVAGDALYVRSPLDDDPFASRVTFGRYLVVAAIYRYFDVIFSVLNDQRAASLLSDHERLALTEEFVSIAPGPRILDRASPPFDLARRVWRRLLGRRLGYQAFWTRREWPDQ